MLYNFGTGQTNYVNEVFQPIGKKICYFLGISQNYLSDNDIWFNNKLIDI